MKFGDNTASSSPPDIDSFFGLNDTVREDRTEGSAGTAPRGVFRAITAVQGSIARSRGRKVEQKRRQELEDLRHAHAGRTPQIGDQHNELEANSVRLSVDEDAAAEFIRAEQRNTLFEEYEQTHRVTLAVAKISMALAGLIMVILGAVAGPQYLNTLFTSPVAVPEILTRIDAVPEDVAQGVVFVGGMVSPVVLLMLVGTGISSLVRGLANRRVDDISYGSATLIGALTVFAALSSHAYLTGLVIGVVTMAVSRVVGRIVAKVGGV